MAEEFQRESSLEQPSDHVKAFREGKLQAAEILKENHASFIAMRGKLQRLQHRDWSNLCLAEKIILWEEFGGDVFMSALTLRKTIHTSFSRLLLLVFSFTREKLFALDTLHALLKMKSSETYINRQASPKVIFVPNWSDFRLDCQFMLHATHVPKAPPLPHMVLKRGTRKQISTEHTFTPCQAISSPVTWQARHQHSQDTPLTPWGLTENWANLGTQKVLKGTVRHTVILLTLRGRWVKCSLSWWARLTRKSVPFCGLISFPEVEWETLLIVC